MQRREFIGLLGGDAASSFALAARKDGLGEEPCARSVLFCSASQRWLCCSPTLTPSAGRARKGARRRGPAEAGARSTLGTAARTAAIRRSINAGRRQGRKAAGAAPIHFRARHTGPAIPGQVRSARTAAGLTDRRARPQQEGVSNEDASCCRHSCDGDRSPRSGEGEAGAIGTPPARLSVVGAARLLPRLPSE